MRLLGTMSLVDIFVKANLKQAQHHLLWNKRKKPEQDFVLGWTADVCRGNKPQTLNLNSHLGCKHRSERISTTLTQTWILSSSYNNLGGDLSAKCPLLASLLFVLIDMKSNIPTTYKRNTYYRTDARWLPGQCRCSPPLRARTKCRTDPPWIL